MHCSSYLTHFVAFDLIHDCVHDQVVKARVLDAKQTALEKKVSWLTVHSVN